MKALVVGGNGFIGSHLVDGLIRSNWDVVVLDIQERRYDAIPPQVHFIQGELTQAYLVREALAGVDVVFHLAWTTFHEVSNQDPAGDVKDNLIPSIQLMELCRQMRVGRVVFISSGGTVYGPAGEIPISENHPTNPLNAYGITKLAVEKYLQMFHQLYGLEYAILRPSVPYGPRQSPLGRQGAVPVFLYRAALGLPISIWGDGSVTRDYFYISDLISALLASAEQKLDYRRVFNLGGSEEVSLNQLIGAVEEVVGRKAIVQHVAGRKFDAPRIIMDTSRAGDVLGWKPNVSLNSGLSQTWSWISRAFNLDGNS